jgi:hypothetical protein
MAKQTFTVGQVLTAAQLTSLQQTAMLGGAASAKTASYTLVAADAGTAISMTSTSATTITVNTGLFAAGDTVQITNLGAGVCTITAGTATVNTSASLALAQYESGTLDFTSASAAIFIKGAGAAASATSFASLNGAGTALTGAATITVSGLSGYNKFFVAITGASSASADSAFTIRFNADTGSNYFYNGLNFNMQTPNILAGSWLAASATASAFPLLGTIQGAAAAQNGAFTIDGANSSGVKIVDLIGINNWQANGGLSWVYKGHYTGTSVISSISIISSVGNFDAGTIIVYGGN